ncbi:type II secretion system protein GspM [Anaerostipes sp.]|uniref:type II secretion system protein GspM n=1 Tax=Anaerostipes sp. TaxID=1872530 RepID=UPI0025B88EC6|nr:type II secretion system protein GspM [Anaerostipes sp.]MBS7009295.1 type II secretion system protein M [Anaerostipes sp.]
MEITTRDKKILCVLSIILMIVVFGNFVIRPLLTQRSELSEEFKEKKQTKETMEKAIASIPQKEARLKASRADFKKETKDIYPMMESHKVERMITKLILNSGLSSRDFEISAKPSVSVMTPYIESSLAKTMGLESSEGSTDSTAEDGSKSTVTQNVLYSYPVSVNILGTKANAKKLIDKIYADYPSIRVVSYGMSSETALTTSNKVIDASTLSLVLEVYMCRK